MSTRSGDQPADRKSDHGTGEVQYLLVGSLVGAILLMILYAIWAAN